MPSIIDGTVKYISPYKDACTIYWTGNDMKKTVPNIQHPSSQLQ